MAPKTMMASYVPFCARRFAASGISNAPGTRTSVERQCFSSGFVTSGRNELLTIAMRISCLFFMASYKRWPGKFVNVLGHDIHFDIDRVADRDMCKRRAIFRMRDNPDTKTLVTHFNQSQRNTIDRNGALLHHVFRKLPGSSERD